MTRIPALIVIALTAFAAGCGGGDEGSELLEEDALRACLVGAGLTAQEPDDSGATSYAPLGNPPDFGLYAENGTSVSVTVYGTDEKADRAAADLEGAIQSVGGADRREVLNDRNAVVTFGAAPTDATRQATENCLQ